MPLDFLTLMAVMAANLFMISAALPLIMGRDVSRAARHVQASMLLQAVAWAAIIASSTLWDQALSTASIACNAAAQWMLYRALEEWLGPRPLRWPLLALVVAAPLGYALGFGHYAWRVGWANGLMAATLCIVARATLYPLAPADARWRRLLLGCLLTAAVFTLARGLLGAFTDQYPSFRTPHPVNLAAALAINVSLVLGTVAVLVAWRYEAEQKLRTLAMTDGLTGLPNRRGFASQGDNLLSHAWRHRLPLTALMLHNPAQAGAAFDRRLRHRLHDASAAELGFVLDYSAGMAALIPGESSLAALMARADAALYDAKTAGRGCLMAAS